jgi:TonB family protein
MQDAVPMAPSKESIDSLHQKVVIKAAPSTEPPLIAPQKTEATTPSAQPFSIAPQKVDAAPPAEPHLAAPGKTEVTSSPEPSSTAPRTNKLQTWGLVVAAGLCGVAVALIALLLIVIFSQPPRQASVRPPPASTAPPSEGSPPETTPDPHVAARLKFQAAQQAFQRHDLTTARKLIDEADAEDPNQPSILNLRGQILAEQKEYDLAEAAFRKAIEIDPNFYEAKKNLADMLWKKDAEKSQAPSPAGTPQISPAEPLSVVKRIFITSAPEGGEPATSFQPDTAGLYAMFKTKGIKGGDKVRGVLIAEDVGNVAPPNTKVLETTLTLDSDTDEGSFIFNNPTKGWPVGNYRVDIYVNDELAATTKFTIEWGDSTKRWPGERFPGTRLWIMRSMEIENWTPAQLRYAINEMYARHGADFLDKDIKRQFTPFEWYHPISGQTYEQTEKLFNATELWNLKLLGEYRDGRKGSTQQQPAQKPKFIYRPYPPYPSAADKMHVSGSGRFKIIFDERGKAKSVEIVQSTGNRALDSNTIKTLKLWRIAPGLPCYVIVPIDYRQKRQSRTPPQVARKASDFPTAKRVPGKPGYVFSPFDANGRYVNVSGYAPGTKVKDPWTDKIFIVPKADTSPRDNHPSYNNPPPPFYQPSEPRAPGMSVDPHPPVGPR